MAFTEIHRADVASDACSLLVWALCCKQAHSLGDHASLPESVCVWRQGVKQGKMLLCCSEAALVPAHIVIRPTAFLSGLGVQWVAPCCCGASAVAKQGVGA